jgi:transcription elongation factor
MTSSRLPSLTFRAYVALSDSSGSTVPNFRTRAASAKTAAHQVGQSGTPATVLVVGTAKL